jgi:uncharacterized membrane protein YgaE (UPF0421/DUF939 family)
MLTQLVRYITDKNLQQTNKDMFKKGVSNVDLYNKLSHLDNKLDIILRKVTSCCDCHIHEHIDDKFVSLQEQIHEVDKKIKVVNEEIMRNRDYMQIDYVDKLEKRVSEQIIDVTYLIREIQKEMNMICH